MNIGILGWGSLCWNPNNLYYDKELGWLENGPLLPIEFSRISSDGRLTLVICPTGTYVNTLYSISTLESPEDSIENLRQREGTLKKYIGWYDKIRNIFFDETFSYKDEILQWIEQTDIDFLVWTNLPEKWETKDGNIINPEDRIQYLQKLDVESKKLALEYIQKTPQQIQTAFRRYFESFKME